MKRHLQEEGGESFRMDSQNSKLRRFALNSLKNVMGGWSTGDIVSRLEPFIRSVVKDEAERAIRNFHEHPTQRSLLTTVGTSEADRGLELRFIGNLPSTIFTGSRIVAEDGSAIRVELFDARSNRIVSMGQLSSMKLEILVLDGDFGSDEQEDWAEKDFSANIIREREGKRPLLNGELSVTLRGGVGYVGELAFTDNSSWVRSRKFRLGVRTLQKIPTQVRIREARSDPFMVKDHRGELYKKHHPPHLLDEVWRLEKISRDGTFHRRLTSHRIHSVKDFLRLYETDPLSLKNILGSGIPNKTWDAIIEHANDCVVDDNKFYGYNHAPQKHCLLFNSVYKVVGATIDGQFFVPLDKLAAHEKALVQNMKKQALKNLHCLFPVDAVSTIAPPRSLSNFETGPLLPGLGSFLQPLEFSIPHQGQPENVGGLSHSSTSISYGCGETEPQSFTFLASPQSNHLPVQVLNATSGNSCITGEFWTGESNVLPNDLSGPLVAPKDHSADEETIFQVQTPNWFH